MSVSGYIDSISWIFLNGHSRKSRRRSSKWKMFYNVQKWLCNVKLKQLFGNTSVCEENVVWMMISLPVKNKENSTHGNVFNNYFNYRWKYNLTSYFSVQEQILETFPSNEPTHLMKASSIGCLIILKFTKKKHSVIKCYLKKMLHICFPSLSLSYVSIWIVKLDFLSFQQINSYECEKSR